MTSITSFVLIDSMEGSAGDRKRGITGSSTLFLFSTDNRERGDSLLGNDAITMLLFSARIVIVVCRVFCLSFFSFLETLVD